MIIDITQVSISYSLKIKPQWVKKKDLFKRNHKYLTRNVTKKKAFHEGIICFYYSDLFHFTKKKKSKGDMKNS